MSDQGCPIVGRKEKVKADEPQAAGCEQCGGTEYGLPIVNPDGKKYCSYGCAEKADPNRLPENLKLNIGGGSKITLEGFTVVDRCVGTEVYPLAYPDECAEEIRASHVLEHFSKKDTLDVLREWVRVLKPGGTIKIAVPDFEWICANLDHPLTEGYVMGGQTDENDFHHALFNREKLTKLMELASLVDIFPWVSDVEDCAALPVSLNLMGTKPGPAIPIDYSQLRIVGCLSAPRIGFMDNFACIATVLAEMGIPMLPHRGALWEQVMQNMLVTAVAQGYDFAVTFDYDSTFRRSDFIALLDYMIKHPDVDAVAPFQPMRGRANTALCGMKSGSELVTGKLKDPIVALTAHFGCTIIRLERLKGIPLPWLWSQPGNTGQWTVEDGKLDADTFFWQKFSQHGRVLHVLPYVSIGHIESMVTMLAHQKNPQTGQGEVKSVTMHASTWMNNVFAETQPGAPKQ